MAGGSYAQQARGLRKHRQQWQGLASSNSEVTPISPFPEERIFWGKGKLWLEGGLLWARWRYLQLLSLRVYTLCMQEPKSGGKPEAGAAQQDQVIGGEIRAERK